MKIRAPPPPIRSEFIMLGGHVPAGATIEILPWTFFKFAVISFQGNGEIGVNVEVGPHPGTIDYVESVFPNWMITKVYANKAVRLVASNPDPYSPRSYPTIYIIYLDW